MSLKPAFAAMLRSVRDAQSRTQENVATATSRTYLGHLENGSSNVSLDKLNELAHSLGLSPLTLIALTLSAHDECSADEALQRAHDEIHKLGEAVKLEVIRAHLVDGKLVKRKPHRPADAEKLARVQACKAKGMTQSAAARELGLSKGTVHLLWH
ncbi:helix-turn-helix domain-containing protein [Pseudomonas plecoglossicida]|uniref:helix-turn-helix domain-containing protein n=1 Tax=Pseudomonas plecoglossicida TaxID=70775 RepID=UPI003977E201